MRTTTIVASVAAVTVTGLASLALVSHYWTPSQSAPTADEAICAAFTKTAAAFNARSPFWIDIVTRQDRMTVSCSDRHFVADKYYAMTSSTTP
jgi:hypothetical protein